MSTEPQPPQSVPTGPHAPVGPAGLWATVDALSSWLDADRAHGGREGLLLRLLKLSEEVGEVAQAVIGATGQNPARASPTRGRTSRANCATWSSRHWWRCGP